MNSASFPARSSIARGGKSIYGAPLGILMLEARFPRIFGDMGNGETWPFPVLFRVVRGASPERVVLNGAQGTLDAFIEAARDLVDLGAEAITTNCGFLALFQRELAEAVQVPVATSSLMQVPWVQATLPPGKRVGVVTVSKPSLTPAHLAGAGNVGGAEAADPDLVEHQGRGQGGEDQEGDAQHPQLVCGALAAQHR